MEYYMTWMVLDYFLVGLLMISVYTVSYPKTGTGWGGLFWFALWPLGIMFGMTRLFMEPGERLRRKLVKAVSRKSSKS